jgi:MFS family permease
VLPLYAASLGANDAYLGLIAAVSPLAGIIFSFPIGVMSDKLGRRKLLIASGCVFLTAPLLYLLIADPVFLIPVRFFHGLATAILGPVAGAAIAEKYGENKGTMMGTYGSATLAGRTAAPLIGGIILTLFALAPGNTAYHMVYLAAFCAAIPVFILILFFRDSKSLVNKVTAADFINSLKVFLSNKGLRAASTAEMITYFCYGTFETFLPVYLLLSGVPTWQTGIIFAVQVVIIALTKPFFGRLADRGNPHKQIAAGMLITGGSLGAIGLSQNFGILLVVSCVFGIGMSLSTVATNVYAADTAKKDEIGASLGALSSIMDIGHASGPLVCGVVIMFAGYQTGFGLCLVLAFLTTLLVLWTGKKKR